MNILVVDDEKEITDLIQIYLENENFTVYKYYSSQDVLRDRFGYLRCNDA